MSYKSETQNKNIAWILPRPKPDHYKGGMPLYCEDWLLDAHYFTEDLKQKFDIILADPPYSNQEAKELYNTPPLKYKIWTKECEKALRKNGLLIIYHKYIMPNPNPEKFKVIKRVFIGGRPYHLPRVAIYFQKD